MSLDNKIEFDRSTDEVADASRFEDMLHGGGEDPSKACDFLSRFCVEISRGFEEAGSEGELSDSGYGLGLKEGSVGNDGVAVSEGVEDVSIENKSGLGHADKDAVLLSVRGRTYLMDKEIFDSFPIGFFSTLRVHVLGLVASSERTAVEKIHGIKGGIQKRIQKFSKFVADMERKRDALFPKVGGRHAQCRNRIASVRRERRKIGERRMT
ncbi:MAG: hypothetical protein PHP74_01510 [Candidatus Gracilibacteria bacterium]|nr:hypothetical protein [Candidatus Gracilibacteria bacterium]